MVQPPLYLTVNNIHLELSCDLHQTEWPAAVITDQSPAVRRQGRSYCFGELTCVRDLIEVRVSLPSSDCQWDARQSSSFSCTLTNLNPALCRVVRLLAIHNPFWHLSQSLPHGLTKEKQGRMSRRRVRDVDISLYY